METMYYTIVEDDQQDVFPLLNLPVEIISKIFSYLDLYDLRTVSLLNKLCHDIFEFDLKYAFHLKAAGMVDGAHCSMSTQEKLQELLRREDSWRDLDLEREVHVRIMHNPSHIYDLSAGTYILGDSRNDFAKRRTLSIRSLNLADCETHGPSVSEIPLRKDAWKELELDSLIIDFGLSIEEHDLIALVEVQIERSDVDQPTTLHLREFSTGAPHPQASKPILDLGVTRKSWGKLSCMIEAVGQCMLVLLSWSKDPDEAGEPLDRLILYNWYTGQKLVEESNRRGIWDGLIFLTPRVFALTDNEDGMLELIYLPDERAPFTQTKLQFDRLLALALPQVNPGYKYISMACRSDPNPFGLQPDFTPSLGSARSRRRPFMPDPELAVVIIRPILLSQEIWDIERIKRFSFVVHRSSILNHLRAAHPWLQADFTQPLPKDMPSPPPRLDWAAWGPAGTRWASDDTLRTPWITSTDGQREVFAGAPHGHVVARDYNPYAVKRALWELGEGMLDARKAVRTGSNPSDDDGWGRVFLSEAGNSLPYVEVKSVELLDYDGVLLDEGYVLGLLVSADNELRTVVVHTI